MVVLVVVVVVVVGRAVLSCVVIGCEAECGGPRSDQRIHHQPTSLPLPLPITRSFLSCPAVTAKFLLSLSTTGIFWMGLAGQLLWQPIRMNPVSGGRLGSLAAFLASFSPSRLCCATTHLFPVYSDQLAMQWRPRHWWQYLELQC